MVEVSVKRFFVVSPQNGKVNQHVILMLMTWFFLMLFGDGYD
jgi:hypothetical protein